MSLRDYGWCSYFANQLGLDELDVLIPARVVAMHRAGIVVTDGTAEFQLPLGSGWFQREPEERPTVGDWLLVAPSQDRVVRLLERKSLLKRLAAGSAAEVQLIAANVDTMFVVTSCNEEFNDSRLERYLAMASGSGTEAVVVLTKRDLAGDPDAYIDRVRAVAAHAAIEPVNALDASTLDGIRACCQPGQTVALVGSSGVGKSTLLNSLAGREVQATGGIREDDAHGRHTTTSRSLHLLAQGALLLDVPGLRELGLSGLDRGASAVFDDIQALASRCRFADCAHQSEPQCAVRAAIESGELDERRFRNYQKLLREEARNAASIAERRQAHRRFAKRVRKVVKEKERFRPN
ncbi:MAG: ribosome small subunit-dependent GTPase A [Gammaproteobacteria bacterium]|nr:ribosome small subunit-dependent GTPase A [Gammaproteobacteria bacterium]